MRFRSVLVAMAASLLAVPVGAQSLFNAAGIGLAADAVDGRARSLGNVGIGLRGGSVSPTDPGAIGMLVAPTATIVGQPSWVDFSRTSGEVGTFRGARFPLMGIAYPLRAGLMGSLSFSSMLDQRFRAQRPVTLDLGGVTQTATDLFEQEGGVAQVNIGVSRRIRPNLSVGVAAIRYSGRVVRRLDRNFDDLGLPAAALTYSDGGLWGYSGFGMTGGFAADFGSALRVAASATWSGGLDATASDDTAGGDRSFDLPFQLRAGASAVLAPGLMVTGSVLRADWEGIADDLPVGTTVGTSNSFGFGLELSRFGLLGKTAPLRFGYRSSDLPFALGPDPATESVWAGGLGLTLSETNGFVLAGADFGIERGERQDGTLFEKFWRATVSLRVSGY